MVYGADMSSGPREIKTFRRAGPTRRCLGTRCVPGIFFLYHVFLDFDPMHPVYGLEQRGPEPLVAWAVGFFSRAFLGLIQISSPWLANIFICETFLYSNKTKKIVQLQR